MTITRNGLGMAQIVAGAALGALGMAAVGAPWEFAATAWVGGMLVGFGFATIWTAPVATAQEPQP